MDSLFSTWLTKNVASIHKKLREINQQGYSGLQLLSQIHTEVVSGSRFNKIEKQKLAILLGKAEKKLFDGADEELQLLYIMTTWL